VDDALVYLSGWIFLGAGLGGVLRFLCSNMVARAFGETFPWGTLLVNVVGSFLIGLFAIITGPDGRLLVGSTARQFVMVGIFGGYTTFSSFSLQTLNLAQDGQWWLVAANIALSLVLCLVSVWLELRRRRRGEPIGDRRCACRRGRPCFSASSWARTTAPAAGRSTRRWC
jgi:CrcB protein